MTTRHWLSLGGVGVFVVVSALWWYLQTPHVSVCLQDGEVAEYEFEDNKRKSPSFVTVRVKRGDEVVEEFTETILSPTHYHPIELHPCGVYFVRGFNYDYTTRTSLPDSKVELWRFDYAGYGEPQVLTYDDELGGLQSHNHYFSSDFRVNHDETFVALIDTEDYSNQSFVIKSLQSGENIFEIRVATIHKDDPSIYGAPSLLDWTDDGRYFWADLHDAAYEIAWIRIDTTDWSYAVYKAPQGILGGYPLDINTGWVTHVPGAFWTGVAQDTDIIRQERLAAGQTTSSLYLYNVITGQELLIDTFDDPVWSGWPHWWLDERTLKYTMPDGEKRTYILE